MAGVSIVAAFDLDRPGSSVALRLATSQRRATTGAETLPPHEAIENSWPDERRL